MNRIFLMVVATLAAAALAGGAGAAGDAKGPPCTDVVDGIAGYTYDAGTGIVTVELTMGAPACAVATYLVDIKNLAGTATLVNDVAPQSTSGSTVTFSYTFTSGAPSDGVCIVAETSIKGHAIDRAPDDGCFPAPANESPASGFH
jgi:hypothetical protein